MRVGRTNEPTSFCALSVDDVTDAIRKLPAKQCATDPLPTHLLKDNVDVLAPFITELFNRSLSSGVFPTQFKAAYRGGAPIGAGGS